MNVDELTNWLDDNGIDRVRVDALSLDGMPVGKVIRGSRFAEAATGGVGITDFLMGIDREGEPALTFTAPWRSTVLGDLLLMPDLATLRIDPAGRGLASCFADVTDVDGTPIPVCGRSLVRSMADRLAQHGLTASVAFEVEGQFFASSFDELRRRGWTDLDPFGVGGHLVYLSQDHHRLDPIMHEICDRLEAAGVPWEAWNAEAAAGQFELNVAPADPLAAADHVIQIRRIAKEVAYERGMSVTFMARVTADYGNGLHIHHSLRRDGEPVLHDPSGELGLSDVARRWISGLMATVAGSASVMAPTPNSFRRIEPFKASPTHATWDVDNKSTALRVLSRSANSARVEHRMGAGDAHPHFAIATILAGGIAGLEHSLDLAPPFTRMAWGLPETTDMPAELPRSAPAAADAMAADPLLRSVLGDGFVDYWTESRRFEWLAFNTNGGDGAAPAPTPWELGRYFETI